MPDDSEFVIEPRLDIVSSKVSFTDVNKAVGTAVPPLLTYHLARRIEEIWPRVYRSNYVIVSYGYDISSRDFESLLDETVSIMSQMAMERVGVYKNTNSEEFEQVVCNTMIKAAKGRPFENAIKLESGYSFPDIVARKIYGVEVKTTVRDRWKTTGNSVLENTRIKSVERIYLFFGKLSDPLQFKYRKYEECLCDVVVTHSPRYLIDMDTKPGETIFEKIGIPYDSLRKMTQPIKPIAKYYRGKLRKGEDLWWLEGEETEVPATSLMVRLWNHLSTDEKNFLKIESMVLFPQIFGNHSQKYSKVATWLASRYGIVSPSLRDTFTAGGRGTITQGVEVFRDVPKIFCELNINVKRVLERIEEIPVTFLERCWEVDMAGRKPLSVWRDLVGDYSKGVYPRHEELLHSLLVH